MSRPYHPPWFDRRKNTVIWKRSEHVKEKKKIRTDTINRSEQSINFIEFFKMHVFLCNSLSRNSVFWAVGSPRIKQISVLMKYFGVECVFGIKINDLTDPVSCVTCNTHTNAYERSRLMSSNFTLRSPRAMTSLQHVGQPRSPNEQSWTLCEWTLSSDHQLVMKYTLWRRWVPVNSTYFLNVDEKQYNFMET